MSRFSLSRSLNCNSIESLSFLIILFRSKILSLCVAFSVASSFSMLDSLTFSKSRSDMDDFKSDESCAIESCNFKFESLSRLSIWPSSSSSAVNCSSTVSLPDRASDKKAWASANTIIKNTTTTNNAANASTNPGQ